MCQMNKYNTIKNEILVEVLETGGKQHLVYTSGSQPVGHDPFGSQMNL